MKVKHKYMKISIPNVSIHTFFYVCFPCKRMSHQQTRGHPCPSGTKRGAGVWQLWGEEQSQTEGDTAARNPLSISNLQVYP